MCFLSMCKQMIIKFFYTTLTLFLMPTKCIQSDLKLSFFSHFINILMIRKYTSVLTMTGVIKFCFWMYWLLSFKNIKQVVCIISWGRKRFSFIMSSKGSKVKKKLKKCRKLLFSWVSKLYFSALFKKKMMVLLTGRTSCMLGCDDGQLSKMSRNIFS